MTKEDKKLLFRYLSMALPYGVKCNIGLEFPLKLQSISVDMLDGILLNFFLTDIHYQVYLSEVKPYLRPLASMTEEELVELNCLCYHNISVQDDMLCGYICGIEIDDVQNFLLHYHFDFMGLIPRDLAIAVTEENNPYNTAEK
jgi:hypothetical protein